MLLARRAMAPVCRTTSVWREHSALFRPFGSVASPLNLRTYTRAEVASHNNDEDLWVVIDGLVYDLTEWQNFHPGSRQVLMELGGKDASEHFSEVGHSEYARNKMKQFLIGKVDSAPRYSGSEYRSRVGEV
jgi:cytochrome b involved in lipid metabolism